MDFLSTCIPEIPYGYHLRNVRSAGMVLGLRKTTQGNGPKRRGRDPALEPHPPGCRASPSVGSAGVCQLLATGRCARGGGCLNFFFHFLRRFFHGLAAFLNILAHPPEGVAARRGNNNQHRGASKENSPYPIHGLTLSCVGGIGPLRSTSNCARVVPRQKRRKMAESTGILAQIVAPATLFYTAHLIWVTTATQERLPPPPPRYRGPEHRLSHTTTQSKPPRFRDRCPAWRSSRSIGRPRSSTRRSCHQIR